jgi:hypothetical protein
MVHALIRADAFDMSDQRRASGMWRRVGANLGALALATIVIGIAACGGDDAGESKAQAAANGTPPGAPDLDRFLMQGGEEPGFRRLREEGFISFAVQPIRGPRTAGISNVALFATAEGARHNMAHELRTDVIRAVDAVANLRRFTVPGIPGARGWTASEPRVGNLWWVQGRCVLVLGNQGPGPFAGPLSTGARAIYERTNGQCP